MLCVFAGCLWSVYRFYHILCDFLWFLVFLMDGYGDVPGFSNVF